MLCVSTIVNTRCRPDIGKKHPLFYNSCQLKVLRYTNSSPQYVVYICHKLFLLHVTVSVFGTAATLVTVIVAQVASAVVKLPSDW